MLVCISYCLHRKIDTNLIAGLFTPTAGQHFREAQRHRHSQYDRGTRLAALEEATYENYGRHYRY
jgi:hypothetical protein